MSDKIFHLEKQIMSVWNVVEDMDMLYHYLGDDPKFAGMSAEAENEMANLLLGLKSLYNVKFEELFKTFGDVCSEYHKRGKIEWPEDELRVDAIGQNGNDGLHYSIDYATPEEWDNAYEVYYKGNKI